MNLLEKFKETASSVLPVMAIVLILGVTAAPLGGDLLLRFTVGGILLITGLTIFCSASTSVSFRSESRAVRS